VLVKCGTHACRADFQAFWCHQAGQGCAQQGSLGRERRSSIHGIRVCAVQDPRAGACGSARGEQQPECIWPQPATDGGVCLGRRSSAARSPAEIGPSADSRDSRPREDSSTGTSCKLSEKICRRGVACQISGKARTARGGAACQIRRKSWTARGAICANGCCIALCGSRKICGQARAAPRAVRPKAA
jgi:hypothetical protein